MPGGIEPFALLLSPPPWVHLQLVAMQAESGLNPPSQGLGGGADRGISALFLGLALLLVIPLAIFLSLRIARFIRSRREKEFIQQLKEQALRHEKAGEFVSAGLLHEKLKDLGRAAGLFGKGGDFARAAGLYESLGDISRAKEMYEKAGDSAKAAELCVMAGDYVEAARIYSRRGDKLRAAQALEMTGNRLAAVRAYREANDYQKAAELLAAEGMYREAAEMCGISLSGRKIDQANAARFYAYASFLEKAGEPQKAGAVYREIAAVAPHYRNAGEKAGMLAPQEEKPVASELPDNAGSRASQKTTLKGLCCSRLEPRYAFRLWVQILKALDARVKQGAFIDNLSPESIAIDASNTVTFCEAVPKNFACRAPESIDGAPVDEVSLIYPMGVLLYEMLAGDLDSFGIKKPGEINNEVPPWLDELVVRCVQRDRAGRYQSFDEIFSALRSLRSGIAS
jgi:tetratricopeptide (TPR) repeat protein